MAGWQDWRSRVTGGGWRGATTTSRTRPRTTDRRATYAPPQSEGRFTPTGWNSPLHNAYVREFSSPSAPYTRAGYGSFVETLKGLGASQAPGTSIMGGGGGGGRGYGYGGGGGGGGGGAPAMTQAMLDAMLRALGTRGPALTLQQTNLPAFRGQALPAFNAQPYNQATQQLTAAGAADRAAAEAAATRASQALQANYTNPYANAPVQATPAAPQVGTGLQATVGGGGDQAAQAAQQNAAAGSDQASFANLLSVLGATDQAAQSSRMNQVALDRNTALANIGAQQRGLLGGIGLARSQAANQWRQAQAERAYQNSLMQQQWQRENLMRNQDVVNQQRQGNWQQGNEFISSRLTPLLEMLGSTAGANLNLTGLENMLRQWQAPR